MIKLACVVASICIFACAMAQAAPSKIDGGVRIKDLGRIASAVDNSLVGYGLVAGLAGTGDSLRNTATGQSVRNMLQTFGINMTADQVRSRNVATVMISASLPPFAQTGDKLDVNVTSIGDARSLAGGTLLRTELSGPDGRVYALAQGALSVGGYQYEMNANLVQKNHPTAGAIPAGATVQRSVHEQIADQGYKIEYALSDPDFTTASRVAETLNHHFGTEMAQAVSAARVSITVPVEQRANLVGFLTKVEAVVVVPDSRSRVVVNERTGTVVSGGDVKISPVSITHGDLKVTVKTDFLVSQPTLVRATGDSVRTVVVPDTKIKVVEEPPLNLVLNKETSVGDLVAALNKVKASSRDIITILQGIKRAGALHAELIIQ